MSFGVGDSLPLRVVGHPDDPSGGALSLTATGSRE
jgi:hypothetical protein